MDKRFVGILIGLVVITSGCMSGDVETQESTNDLDEPVEDEGQDTETEEVSRTHNLNEQFSLGDITYEVKDYKTGQVIGDQFYQEEASGEFVQIEIEVTNNENEPVYFSDNHMRLVDEQDREYSVQSGSVANIENAFLFEELQPGLTESGILLYDVPQDQNERQLKISPPSIVSMDEPHYVNLPVEQAGDIEEPEEEEDPMDDFDSDFDDDFNY